MDGDDIDEDDVDDEEVEEEEEEEEEEEDEERYSISFKLNGKEVSARATHRYSGYYLYPSCFFLFIISLFLSTY